MFTYLIRLLDTLHTMLKTEYDETVWDQRPGEFAMVRSIARVYWSLMYVKLQARLCIRRFIASFIRRKIVRAFSVILPREVVLTIVDHMDVHIYPALNARFSSMPFMAIGLFDLDGAGFLRRALNDEMLHQ